MTSLIHERELKAGVSFCDSCPVPQNVTDHETLDGKVFVNWHTEVKSQGTFSFVCLFVLKSTKIGTLRKVLMET